MKRLHLAALLGLASAAGSSALAQSAVPNLMSYQSRVADAAGVPLGNTTPVNRIVLFRIYDSPNLSAPANRLYSEQQTVTIAAGEFSVLIGSGTAISTETTNAYSTLSAAVFGGSSRYLGVTVDDGDGNPFNDPELSPRQQIVGTPFAFRAQTAESVALGGVSALSLANNAVTTAAIAPGAVTGSQLAPAAVDTTQVADNAVTLEKHATNSVDSSKIVDGSIALADLAPAIQAAISTKPTYTYDQGLVTFSGSSGTREWIVFPIDVSDLAVDGEVMISYMGGRRAGFTNNKIPPVFGGKMRVVLATFSPGGGGLSYSTGGFSLSPGSGSPTTNTVPDLGTPFFVESRGPNPEGNFTASGFLNSNEISVVYASPPASTFPGIPTSIIFPLKAISISGTTGNSGNGGLPIYTPSTGGASPIGAAGVYFQGDGNFGAASGAGQFSVSEIPFVYLFHYFPGSLPQGPTSFTSNLPNQSGATSFGPPQTIKVASVVTGTNKLIITTDNPHTIGVGDTVALSGVTGSPAANGSFTVAATPDRSRFEITLNGAAGTYTGGNITHTLRYNKYRMWIAVYWGPVAVRVTVSDK